MVGKCGITLWQDDQQATWEPLHVCAAAKIEELSRLLGSVDRTLLLLHLGNCWQDHRQTTSGSSRKQITFKPWSRLVEPLLHTVTNLSNLTQTHSNLPEFWKPNLWGIAYSRKIIGTRFAHRLKLREGVKKTFLGQSATLLMSPSPQRYIILSCRLGVLTWDRRPQYVQSVSADAISGFFHSKLTLEKESRVFTLLVMMVLLTITVFDDRQSGDSICCFCSSLLDKSNYGNVPQELEGRGLTLSLYLTYLSLVWYAFVFRIWIWNAH